MKKKYVSKYSKFLFVVAGFICILSTLNPKLLLAAEGDRYYFGKSGSTAANSFLYRSPAPTLYGSASTYNFGGSFGTSKFIFVQRGVAIDLTSLPAATPLAGIGMKFIKMDYNTGEPVSPITYGCPNNGGSGQPFTLAFVPESSVANFADMTASPTVMLGQFPQFDPYGVINYFNGGFTLQADGTCLIGAGGDSDDWPLAEDYFIIIANPEGLGASGDPELTGTQYWSPLGNNQARKTREIVDDTVSRDYNGMVVNGNSEVLSYVNQLIGDTFVNLEFYFGEGAAIISPPPPVEAFSCNPFTNDITSLYLNTNFSFYGCMKSVVTWTFIPSDASLTQFSTLTLENSFPFNYIYEIGDVYNELFANPSGQDFDIEISTGIGDITLMSASILSAVPFADDIKDILGYICYLLTIFAIYKMIIKVHSTQH